MLAQALREAQSARDKTKAAQLHEKMVFSRYEELGVIKSVLKSALKWRKKGEDEVKSELGQFVRLMSTDGFPVGADVLFAGLDLSPLGPQALEEHQRWQCYDVGYQLAISGQDRAAHLQPGNSMYDACDRGWLAGERGPEGVPSAQGGDGVDRKERAPEAAPAPCARTARRRCGDDAAQRDAAKAAPKWRRATVRLGRLRPTRMTIWASGIPDVPAAATNGAAKRGRKPRSQGAPAPVQMGGKRRGRPPRSARVH